MAHISVKSGRRERGELLKLAQSYQKTQRLLPITFAWLLIHPAHLKFCLNSSPFPVWHYNFICLLIFYLSNTMSCFTMLKRKWLPSPTMRQRLSKVKCLCFWLDLNQLKDWTVFYKHQSGMTIEASIWLTNKNIENILSIIKSMDSVQ